MKNKLWWRLLLWGLTLATAGAIFWFSSQTAEQSGSLSGEVTQGLFGYLFSLFRLSEEVQIAVHVGLRSAAHIGIFAVLGLFASLLSYSYTRRFWHAITAISCVLYAVTDEWHQLLVGAGRAFEWSDVVRDSMGVFLGIGTTALITALYTRLKRKGK